VEAGGAPNQGDVLEIFGAAVFRARSIKSPDFSGMERVQPKAREKQVVVCGKFPGAAARLGCQSDDIDRKIANAGLSREMAQGRLGKCGCSIGRSEREAVAPRDIASKKTMSGLISLMRSELRRIFPGIGGGSRGSWRRRSKGHRRRLIGIFTSRFWDHIPLTGVLGRVTQGALTTKPRMGWIESFWPRTYGKQRQRWKLIPSSMKTAGVGPTPDTRRCWTICGRGLQHETALKRVGKKRARFRNEETGR